MMSELGSKILTPDGFLEVLEVSDDISTALVAFEGPIEEKQEKVDFWRSKIPWFGEQVDLKCTLGRRASKVSLEKLYDFLEYYRETKQLVESAKRAGIAWPTVKKRLVKGGKFYLKDFAAAFDAVNDEIGAGLVDIVSKKAWEGNDAHPGSLKAAKVLMDRADKMSDNRKPEKKDIRPVNVLVNTVSENARLTGKVIEVS